MGFYIQHENVQNAINYLLYYVYSILITFLIPKLNLCLVQNSYLRIMKLKFAKNMRITVTYNLIL